MNIPSIFFISWHSILIAMPDDDGMPASAGMTMGAGMTYKSFLRRKGSIQTTIQEEQKEKI